MNGFHSDVEDDEDFVLVVPIEAKRPREGSDDDEDNQPSPQKQHRLASVEEDIATLVQLNGEIETIRDANSSDAEYRATNYILMLYEGKAIDDNRNFEDVPADLVIKLNRSRDIFRKLIPADIINFGAILVFVENGRVLNTYRVFVKHWISFYLDGVIPEPFRIQTPKTTYFDTATRLVAESFKRAKDAYSTLATYEPVTKPFISASRMFVDEYIRGFEKVVEETRQTHVRCGGLVEAFRRHWVVEYDILTPTIDLRLRNVVSDEEISGWFSLVWRFSEMLKGGVVLTESEMRTLMAILKKSSTSSTATQTALAIVRKEFRAAIGDVAFEIRESIALLPGIVVDKAKLVGLYAGTVRMDEFDFDRIRFCTNGREWTRFATAHNNIAKLRADIRPLTLAPHAKNKNGPKIARLIRLVRSLENGKAKESYLAQLRRKMHQDINEKRKPIKPVRPEDATVWHQEIEDLFYEIRTDYFVRSVRFQSEKDKFNEFVYPRSTLPKTYQYRTGARREAMLVRHMVNIIVNITHALITGDMRHLNRLSLTEVVISDLSRLYTVEEAMEHLGTQNKQLYRRWKRVVMSVINALIADNMAEAQMSEAGPSSSRVGDMIGRLVAVADSQTLHKDAAKLAKCVGHTSSARPSYLLNQAFVDGPEHDNAEYAAVRTQLMTHLDTAFDNHTREMVELALELKKLSIASDHADTLAQLAVSQFSQRL